MTESLEHVYELFYHLIAHFSKETNLKVAKIIVLSLSHLFPIKF